MFWEVRGTVSEARSGCLGQNQRDTNARPAGASLTQQLLLPRRCQRAVGQATWQGEREERLRPHGEGGEETSAPPARGGWAKERRALRVSMGLGSFL